MSGKIWSGDPSFNFVESDEVALALEFSEDFELFLDLVELGSQIGNSLFRELLAFWGTSCLSQFLKLEIFVGGGIDNISWGANFLDEFGKVEVCLGFCGWPGVEKDIFVLVEGVKVALEVLAVHFEGNFFRLAAILRVSEHGQGLELSLKICPVDDLAVSFVPQIFGDIEVIVRNRAEDESPVSSGVEVLIEGLKELIIDLDEFSLGVQSGQKTFILVLDGSRVGEGKSEGDLAAVLFEVVILLDGLGVAGQNELLSQNVLENDFSKQFELLFIDVVVVFLGQAEVSSDVSSSCALVLNQSRDVDIFISSLSLQLVDVFVGKLVVDDLGSDDDLRADVLSDLSPHFVDAFVGADGDEVGLVSEIAEDFLAVLGVGFVFFELLESELLAFVVNVGLDGVLSGVEVIEDLGSCVVVAEDSGLLDVFGEMVYNEVSFLVLVEVSDQFIHLNFISGVGNFVIVVKTVEF